MKKVRGKGVTPQRILKRNTQEDHATKQSSFFSALRIICSLVLAFSCVGLSGCKISDVLTELLVDQNAETHETDSFFVNNVITSMIDTDNLPELEKDEQMDLERDRIRELPTEGEITDATQETPTTIYRETADSLGQAPAPGQESGIASENSDAPGASSTQIGEGDSVIGGGTGPSEEEPPEAESTPVYKGKGGNGLTYGSDGTYTELPEDVQTVVAFGECANMVASFAGEHALVGADAEFLTNSFIQRAWGNVIADAQIVGVDNNAQTIDVNKVVELEPDALFLLGSTYVLSESDYELLAENKIDVVYLPALTSASNITATATYIGTMFGGSDNTFSGKDARAAAETYVSWHNDLVNRLIQANGGLASTKNYDTGATDDDNLGAVNRWTLYIDDWDYATYYATPDNTSAWTDTGGVAISKAGYRWSPMSYYMSVGGSNNNAATFKPVFYDVTANYYVWQFNLGRVTSVNDNNWAGRTKSVSPLSNSGTSDLLVRAVDGDAQLGSSAFPYVVVRNQSIKNALNSSQSQSVGLYAIYGIVTPANGSSSGRGFLSGTGALCEAFIAGSFGVEVNPTGLYSNWIDGSPESVLEAAWIYDLNTGSSMLDEQIRTYYDLFYGYTISDDEVRTILAGSPE